MNDQVNLHLEKALSIYSSGEFYETLKKAKEEYFRLTGIVFEDDEDYESRMRSFNEWYLLQYTPEGSNQPLIDSYIKDLGISDGCLKLFGHTLFSIFEYAGSNFKGQIVLKDILNNRKVFLVKEHEGLSLIKNEIFLGRVVQEDLSKAGVLLRGLTMLPPDVKSVLKKRSKQIRKLEDPNEANEFLFEVETFKTKWKRYGHIDPSKIFVFTG